MSSQLNESVVGLYFSLPRPTPQNHYLAYLFISRPSRETTLLDSKKNGKLCGRPSQSSRITPGSLQQSFSLTPPLTTQAPPLTYIAAPPSLPSQPSFTLILKPPSWYFKQHPQISAHLNHHNHLNHHHLILLF